jgi:proteasome activator subunit 4
MIGELATSDQTDSVKKNGNSPEGDLTPGVKGMMSLPSFKLDDGGYFDGSDSLQDEEPRLADDEEDLMLRETTASFADWVAGFIRRVILLLENLPDEGVTGNYASGASEGNITSYGIDSD